LRLLTYPAIALEISQAERDALEACEEPGIELLRELIDNLRAQPAQNSAQVIERWAGKPGGDSLEKLLQREQIVADAVAATAELRAALAKLAFLVVERRLEALQQKSRLTRLGEEELEEFQRLMGIRGPRDARGG
jgi:DNA primase